MKTTILASFFAIMLMVSFNAYPFNSGEDPGKKAGLTGKVVDQQTGEELPGATVMVRGTDIKAFTDFNGNFTLDNLEPGIYDLEVVFISYRKAEIKDLKLTSGMSRNMNIDLSQE